MEALKTRIRVVVEPVTDAIARMGIHPSVLTILGLAFSGLAAVVYAKGYFPFGGILLFLAGFCDMTDGPVARATGKGSRFGAFLDSTMDRYSELLVYLGIAAYYVQAGRVEWIAVFLAFSGSMMVSYTRARAEGLGTDCRVGWVQRPERLAVLIVASLLGVWVTGWVLWALAVLTHLTSAQRIHHVYVVMNRPELRS